MQAEAARWSLEVAGQRACRPLEGAAPAAVFGAVEKDALRPLPAGRSCWPPGRRRRSARTSTPRSRRCSTRCRGGTSARPPTCASPARMVQFFIGGDLVKSHPRKVRGKQTDFSDYPPEKIAFHMRTPAWCRRQAAGIGPSCEYLIGELLAEQRALPAPRRPGRHRAGRQARSVPARGGLREGDHGRATRPTGRCGASSPPAPSGISCPPRPGTAGRRRSCAAPRRSRMSSPCPASAIPSDAVTPGTAEGASS